MSRVQFCMMLYFLLIERKKIKKKKPKETARELFSLGEKK
jgi:hypothetical protein